MKRTPPGGRVMVELLRLGTVLLLTAGGYTLGPTLDVLLDVGEAETTRLISSVLGALVGYVVGGLLGRAFVHGVESASRQLEQVAASQLIAAGLGAAVGALTGAAVLLPILLLPYQRFTVPVTLVVVLALAYAGARLGAARGGDLGRFVGLRGRLDVRTPSRGSGVKLVDSSALIDGRLVEVARTGFLEGTLVVPNFVLEEIQGLADAQDATRARRGRRALDTLKVLLDEGLVAVEISDDDVASFTEVDARLAALARQRQAALITGDAALARVAEISGVRVLNLHALAEATRPPVLPGDRLEVYVLRPGREPGQGIGYLDDGTMVVIDGGQDLVGHEVSLDVTSIVQNRQGRLLFGVPSGGAS